MTTTTSHPAPPSVDEVRARLADHLAGLVTPGGAVPGHCRGRVLETALTLRLGALTGLPCPRETAGMRRFLAGVGETVPLERVVLRLARDGARPGTPYRAAELLRGFDHHTAGPKRELVDVVLRLLGADVPLPATLTELPDLAALHTWKRVERLSHKAIACHALGRPELLRDHELDALVATVDTPEIWEGNVLSRLIVLFALHTRGPAQAARVRAGLRGVLATARPDGGIPFILDWSVGATALTGMGLAGRTDRRDVTARLGERLAALQQPDGGWTYTPHSTQTDAEDSSYGLQALHALDPVRYADPVRRGLRYYLELQNDDGGFPTYLRGNPSEAAMTAEGVVCLGLAGAEHADRVRRGLLHLIDRQHPDGTFELSWSRSHSSAVFRCVRALGLARSLPQLRPDVRPAAVRAARRSVDHLLATRNPDGGWGHLPGSASDTVSTAFSVIALLTADPAARGTADLPSVPAAVAAGLRHLAERQRPDGGFDCVTDEVGPRPIPYDVPHSSLGFVLKALNFAASRGRTPHYA
ncbi:prenyltransferase/squalene oxidase repeat-containing protein [Kitasatospora sp. NPDC088134]|uniref:prenyltransferase/squalene oxidase repeat-containing protein n=1 Tax=Kitasatospora sp. NPDC088134 TaxID=3364071 RepID=UPI003820EFF8